jgi:proteic killer suppression protein
MGGAPESQSGFAPGANRYELVISHAPTFMMLNGALKAVANRIAMLYTRFVITSFRHKGLEAFFRSGSKAGIRPTHAKRLQLQLARLEAAKSPEDLGLPAWRLHPLTGTLKNHWAVRVDKNWRMTFTFEREDAVLVDYHDYH